MSPRTCLFAPGSRSERFDKALGSAADAIILDLEDAVPAAQKGVFGTVDFALDMDLSGDPAGCGCAAARIAVASRASGLDTPVAGVTVDIQDAERIRTELARARAHGFGAKLGIPTARCRWCTTHCGLTRRHSTGRGVSCLPPRPPVTQPFRRTAEWSTNR